jgi:signal transduction histidine kinase
MRASPNPEPLHEQLAAVAERAFAGTEVVVHLTQTGTARPYPATAETEIVGIAGEAMTNARRHADCRTVWVACAYDPGELRVAVRDDGSGFDTSQPTPVGHWGLVGMRERVTAIGATLTVTSAPGAGTEVILALPDRAGWPARWKRLVRRDSGAEP